MSKRSFLSKITGSRKDDDGDEVFDQIEERRQGGEVGVQESDLGEETEEWLEDDNSNEGQLAVDVFQDAKNIIIKSTIAGVGPDDIDVNINNDMVTIKGARHMEETVGEEDYFYQECYWGSFSRSIVLPQEVEAEKAQASLKNGVLTLVLPKAAQRQPVEIKVEGN